MIKGQKLNVKVNNSRKKQYITVASICLVLLIVIGGTYAYWTTTKVQEDKNVINTTCLKLIYENKTLAGNTTSPINLEKAYPISDAEGKSLTGYTFTLKNECDSYVSYNVNLESLKEVAEGSRINSDNIDTILNDGAVVGLTTYASIPSLIEGDKTYETRRLETGTLGPKNEGNDSIEYTLRMWIDKNTPDSEMSKSYKGKISIYGTVVAPENAVEKITKLANQPAAASTETTTQLAVDDTADQNIRYIGKDPANYVDIGNGVYQTDIYHGYNGTSKTDFVEYTSKEACNNGVDGQYNIGCTLIHKKGDPILWRIIGVMNNVEGGTKGSEKRLKIIREEGIGEIYWDEKCNEGIDETGECTGSNDSYNNWQNASLNKLLNDAYWNRDITKTANYGRDALEKQPTVYYQYYDFSNIGIKKISKNLFEEAKWYLGGLKSDESSTATATIYYSKEHADNVYSTNPTSTNAMVGLMYVSDYGYATSGGPNKDRTSCLEKELYNWNDSEYVDCKTNDWLWDSEYYQWTISPYVSNDSHAANVYDNGYVSPGDGVDNEYRVRPVLYLKSDVKIVSGDGTKTNPYKLTI